MTTTATVPSEPDYRALLKKYIHLILDAEGIDYLDHAGSYGNVPLTDYEKIQLELIRNEVGQER